MASTYSTSLKIQLMGNGEDSGTWGSITNTNWNLIEQAVSGVQSIVMGNANYTLSNLNGVSDEARNMVLVVTGTNSGIYQIVAPLVPKFFVVTNSTSGGYAITIGGATGSVVSVPNGTTIQVYCDGTNFYSAQTSSAGNFNVNGNLTVSGTTTINALNATSINATTGSFSGNLASIGSVSGASGIFGTVSGTTGTFSSTISGTTITASTQFSGPGTGLTGTATSLNIGGNAATATTATTANATAYSVVFSNAGAGDAANSSFNGSATKNISFNTIGAPSTTGANASGTWGINITGNATTATTAGTANALNSANNYYVSHLQVSDGILTSGNQTGGGIFATYRYDGTMYTSANGKTDFIVRQNDSCQFTGMTVYNTVSCYPSDGYPDTHNKAMTNYDYRIGSWAVGTGGTYLQVFIDGNAYGISIFASDASLKKNIAESNYEALNIVKQIQFKQFDWNEEKSIGKGHENIGFISQDLQAIDPTLVTKIENFRNPENTLLQPNENKLLIIALKSIQELEAKVAALETKLAKG